VMKGDMNVPKELIDAGYGKMVESLEHWQAMLRHYSKDSVAQAHAEVSREVEKYFDELLGLIIQRKDALLRDVAVAFNAQKKSGAS